VEKMKQFKRAEILSITTYVLLCRWIYVILINSN
jgi:hypothetical protein